MGRGPIGDATAADEREPGVDDAPASGPIAASPEGDPEAIHLPDGASAARVGRALELRDAGGRLLVRYVDGAAEIAAPAGDLTLSAPAGRVRIRSALDVEIEAARDVSLGAERRVSLTAGEEGHAPQITLDPAAMRVKTDRLDVEAKASRVVTGRATIVAQQIATTAQRIASNVDRYELTATRVVEKTRDAFRTVVDLAETRIGRARTLIKGVYALRAQRALVSAEDEFKADGKKVLLG